MRREFKLGANGVLRRTMTRHCRTAVYVLPSDARSIAAPQHRQLGSYRDWSVVGLPGALPSLRWQRPQRAATIRVSAERQEANFALYLECVASMKSASLLPLRVAPNFRIELEVVREHAESLSQFVENVVRTT